MSIKFITVVILFLFNFDVTAQMPVKEKQLWKEYAVCVCVSKALERDSVSIQNDISPAVYFDYLNYAPAAFDIVNRYASKIAARVKPTGYADYGNAKPYFFECFKLWNAAETEKVLLSITKMKNK